MFNVKALLESALHHSRRFIRQVTHTKKSEVKSALKESKNCTFSDNCCKLSGRSLEGSAIKSGLHQTGRDSTSCISSYSGGRSLINYLRPLTSNFVQNLVRKVSNPLWTETRRRGVNRLFGETAPYFALVGVTLVSGPERGLLTAHDEVEALCEDIREAICRAGWIHNPDYWRDYSHSSQSFQTGQSFTLSDFELGPLIRKGCSAAVYSARWCKDEIGKKFEMNTTSELTSNEKFPLRTPIWSLDEIQTLQQPILSEGNNSEITEDSLEACALPATSKTEPNLLTDYNTPYCHESEGSPLSNDVDFLLSTGGFNELQKKKVKYKGMLNMPSDRRPFTKNDHDDSDMKRYPLAMKMMFNYEAESNAPTILMAMYKELLPAKNINLGSCSSMYQQRMLDGNSPLPPHPNIVEMPCVFVDNIPLLDGGMNMYPEALPKRLNPSGFGRNMSLFCVMKRYDCCLFEYINERRPSFHTSLLLFTQLLEGLLHLNKCNIVHRDLKSDNILISLSEGLNYPHLVVTDFGCCFCDQSAQMNAPFPSYEADPRLGNAALMAPEVKTATPGILSWINYTRSDIWTAGTLAYEIFGLENPFAPRNTPKGKVSVCLDSANFRESQLPKLPRTISPPIRKLISGLLQRDLKQRPSPVVAANVCQLVLWAPRSWLNKYTLAFPSHNEVTKWLLCLSTKVLCEAGVSTKDKSFPISDRQGGILEYEIVTTFLSRIHYNEVIQAIRYLRSI